MKRLNSKKMSVNGLFNNEQNVTKKGHVSNYLKAITLVVIFGITSIFSKDIQNAFIKNYNNSVDFVQKHNSSIIIPLGV